MNLFLVNCSNKKFAFITIFVIEFAFQAANVNCTVGDFELQKFEVLDDMESLTL